TATSSGALARLGTLAPSLRESERKIADYILARPEEIIYLSVTELADRTDTSEATVIRFAQRLGYSGYAALKIPLTMDRRHSPPPLPSDLTPETGLASIKRHIIPANIFNRN